MTNMRKHQHEALLLFVVANNGYLKIKQKNKIEMKYKI